jgi:hypothetical protein
MVTVASTRRSDAELESILYETANWTVMGSQGRTYCEVASLRLAIDEAGGLHGKGREVSALVCLRPTKIMVFPGQIMTMVNRLSEPEPYPILRVMEA